jgi:hypothetical protein
VKCHHVAAVLALAAIAAAGVGCAGTPTRPDDRRDTGSSAQTQSSGTMRALRWLESGDASTPMVSVADSYVYVG